jgi:Fe-S cluster biogenesis protein NfuA
MCASVRLHPEATPDPRSLRWVTDTALVEPTPAMTDLLADGTLAELAITPGAISTRLAEGHSWAVDGPRVRSVLFRALSTACATDDVPSADRMLHQISEVITREVAPFVSSHGGSIRVVSIADDTVTVALDGTCGHCTLRTQTLRNVVTNAVRAKFPQIRQVRAVRAAGTHER